MLQIPYYLDCQFLLLFVIIVYILRKNSACRILRLSQADICNLKQVIFLIRLNLATLKG